VSLFRCPSNPARAAPGLAGLTHYVGIAGLGQDAADLAFGYPGVCVFGCDRKTRKDDITDGLATTMMAAETARDNGPWTAGGPATVRGLCLDAEPYLGRGGQFGGSHPGGANVLFADASVHFVSESLSPQLFEALATIAGGEDVSGWDARQ
jgi:prepilin-type processing-associated H-X9-DG protein